MTVTELLTLMALMQCHTMAVDIPERRETVVQTVCVKTEITPIKEEPKPIVKPAAKKKAGVKCKRKYYWKNKRKYWRCVR